MIKDLGIALIIYGANGVRQGLILIFGLNQLFAFTFLPSVE